MKTSLLTILALSFSISICTAAINNNNNPWDLSKMSVGDIYNLDDVLFDMDKVDFKHGSESIAALLDFLLTNKNVKVELRGHTNSIPAHDYCDQLSQQRAQKVKDYLVNEGVNPDNLIAKGYGKRVPASFNTNAEGRTSNQRVDVKILSF